MKKTWIAGTVAALTLIAGLALAESEETRHVVVKLAGVGGDSGLSTFDLSDLAVGESREITGDSGRTITVQRDAAGYLLDLGDGKTMRLDGEDGIQMGGEGHHSIHVNKRVIRLHGDGEGDAAGEHHVRIFKSDDGTITELSGDGDVEWHADGAHEGHPRVMIFKSEDGTVTEITGDHDVEWVSETGDKHVVKRIVRLGDGEGGEDVEMLLETLEAGGEMDDAEIQALLERLKAQNPCVEGDSDCHPPKVILINKRVEKSVSED